jgi:Fur family peroxide stress response transcriptional regulator
MILQEKDAEELNGMVQRLRERGHRLTPQRMAILRTVVGDPSHPTAEQIHQAIVSDFPMLSLATVYKTVNMLKEMEEIAELTVDGCGHYDRNTAPHPHLICEVCRAIIDLPSETLVEVLPSELEDMAFQPVRYNVEIYGLCPRCQEQKKSNHYKGG